MSSGMAEREVGGRNQGASVNGGEDGVWDRMGVPTTVEEQRNQRHGDQV